MYRKYGDNKHISTSMGTMWLYLSSLFIVFLTTSGFSLKLFELPWDIISILLLSGSWKVSSVGQPSNWIRSICARSLGETWYLTSLRVPWTSQKYPVYSPPKIDTNKFSGINAKVNYCSAGHVDSSSIDTFLLLEVVSWLTQRIKVNFEPPHKSWYHGREILVK